MSMIQGTFVHFAGGLKKIPVVRESIRREGKHPV